MLPKAESVTKMLPFSVEESNWILDAIYKAGGVVEDALLFGLPMEYSVWVPRYLNIRCKDCGKKLMRVPCSQCCERPYDELIEEETETKPSKPDVTLSLPGSSGKLEVMRKRVEKGQAVFCDGDAIGEPVAPTRNPYFRHVYKVRDLLRERDSRDESFRWNKGAS